MPVYLWRASALQLEARVVREVSVGGTTVHAIEEIEGSVRGGGGG